jgi:hypothetical protein
MSQELTQAGEFRGEIVDYSAQESSTSDSVAVVIQVRINEIWHEGNWEDWSEHDFVVWGYMWVIGRNGQVVKCHAEPLMKYAGWDGSFGSIANRTWHPSPIAITVAGKEYEGRTSYEINWINDPDRTPGGSGQVLDSAVSKKLDSKFGKQFRGLAGNLKRGEIKPKGPAPVQTPLGATIVPDEDEVPF